MTKQKRKGDRRVLITRIVSLALAGLMVFSVVIAAVWTQIY